MKDKRFDIKKVIEWLGLILKCPICGQKYTAEQTQVIDSAHDLGAGEAHIVIHSDCAKCKSSVMFNVDINGPEVFSVGMVTDLTSRDSEKFRNKNPISSDEVIGIHQELKKFKGDFVRSFTQSK